MEDQSVDRNNPPDRAGESHALSTAPARAVDVLLDSIRACGTDTVFGVPGGNIAAVTQALRARTDMRFVIASHEAGAAFMADGYARSGGALGVCAVTAGPGVTNALTGVASAHLDNTPMLFLSGQAATDRFGLSTMQESTSEGGINTVEMVRHCAAASTMVADVRSFPRLLARSLRAARSLPGGVAHLCLPSNLGGLAVPEPEFAERIVVDSRSPAIAPAAVREVLERLLRAKRPLIYLGSGSRAAMAALHAPFAAMVERLGLPVATSVRAKGVFDERHPNSLGVYGIAGSRRAERYFADGADLMLVIGSRLGEWSSKSFAPALVSVGSTIQVDLVAANIGQRRSADMAVVADARAFIQALIEAGDSQREARPLPAMAADAVAPFADGSGAMKPQRVVEEIDRAITADTDVYIDMGNCTGWATHLLRITPPARIFVPCGLSSMGWSCGAVIGGKLARPERTAISLLGDGAFLMNGAELRTAARYGVGTVTVVLQDNYLGMVNHGERSAGATHPVDDPYFYLGALDLERVAEGLGADAYAAHDAHGMRRALSAAIANAAQREKPQVVVAYIDYRECPPYGDRFSSVAAASEAR